MKILKLLILLLIVMGQNFAVKSQSKAVFNHLLVQNGLSQSTVYCMLQDSDGFIWIGTRDGLNRYDGYEFKIYRTDDADTTSISDNQVFSIVEDQHGQIWVGTNYGLNVYNKNTDSFTRFVHSETNKQSLNNNHVYALLADSRGNIWAGTDGGGVSVFYIEQQTFEPLFDGNQNLEKAKVRTIVELPDGQIWIGTKGDGIAIYSKGNLSYVLTNSNNFCGLLSNSIRLIYSDLKNNLWIGSDEHGLTKFNLKSQTYKHYSMNTDPQLCHNAVRAICEDAEGNIWIGTRVGLNLVDGYTGEISYFYNEELNDNSLSNNSIRSIIQDNSGNLWFGTYYGGINVIYGSSNNFTLYKPNVYINNGLSYHIVSSFAQNSKNTIWVGTEGGGVNMLNKKTNKFTTLLNKPNQNSLVNNNVKALYIDNNDKLWIGTYGGGLDIYDIKRKQFINYQNNPLDSTTISSNYIYSIYHDTKDRIWIGANMGGINMFNPQSNKFSRVPLYTKEGDLINGETINDIIEDENGNVWFATDIGLLVYNNKTFRWIDILNGNETINTLSLGYDNFGTIWVGTEGSGMFSVDPDSEKVVQYTQKQGIQGFVIYGIKCDVKHNLWVSTNNGLIKFPLSKHYNLPFKTDTLIVNYDVSDGLQSNEFNRGASFVSIDSTFYFGGLKGFNAFNPLKISRNATKPPVVITGFYLANTKIEKYGNNSPLSKHISKTKQLILTHRQSSFSFEFVSLNYDKPQKNQYAYMLQGFDSDWVNAGKNHRATYTNIFPGEYIFKVKASNNDNLWNNEGTQIKITVLPPFWRTRLAFVIYIVLIALLLLAFRKIVVFSTNQKNLLENERLEKQRIEELNQMKLRFFTNISHEFRTPLTLISGPLEKLMKIPSIPAEEKNYLYALMHKNMSRLHRLINQLMDFRKLENKKMKLNVSSGNLAIFLQDVVQGFSEFCKQKDIELKVITDGENSSNYWFDKNVVDNVIFILLSNAIKFTQASGQISVSLKCDNEIAEIKVVDTGIGITKEKLAWIFERFYSDDSLKYTKSMGTGIGLSFAQSLVELHKGEITVESEENKGTTFTIKIPISKMGYAPDEIKTKSKYILDAQHKPVPEVIPQFSSQTDAENNESILVVEDNLELREFIKSHFRHYMLYDAENGKDAFKLAKKYLPDLIISDVMMPVMDGMELCKAVKSNQITSHIPVILLTAKANIEHKVEGTNSGADIYMEKPFNIELLNANVCNLLLQRKALQERFAGHIVSDIPEGEFYTMEDEFIKKVQEIIFDKKSDPDLTVEYLGDKLGLSRSQLFRKFKALTNHSPNEFIKVVRLKYATELMVKGELNVNQITFECGFSSASHFIASFKKYYNKTPKEYANLINSKKQ
ncbi:MAG: ATP-binding protein [Salinivirgaceae bacterium]|jgi:signal transduction histidine kinase/ligand-binding sensor domain-containing protein/DNA-binding response OmpR family regulator|nr:ATP-binding protein [Salinivirgaceae bacterium]